MTISDVLLSLLNRNFSFVEQEGQKGMTKCTASFTEKVNRRTLTTIFNIFNCLKADCIALSLFEYADLTYPKEGIRFVTYWQPLDLGLVQP